MLLVVRCHSLPLRTSRAETGEQERSGQKRIRERHAIADRDGRENRNLALELPA